MGVAAIAFLTVLAVTGVTACNTPSGTPIGGGGRTARPAATPVAPVAAGAPTEEEVMATMERVFAELYDTDVSGAKSTGVKLTYGAIQVGPLTNSQVEWGVEAQAVYPVRAEVTVEASYENYPGAPTYSRTTTWGTRSDQTFLFYKDAFGDWTFKTGRV